MQVQGKHLRFSSVLFGTVYALCTVVSDRLLYELGNEVGGDWKDLAMCLGLTFCDMDNIETEAHSSREQAWKMLQLWRSKMRKDFSVHEIQKTLNQIRKAKQTKQQKKCKLLCSFYFDCN